MTCEAVLGLVFVINWNNELLRQYSYVSYYKHTLLSDDFTMYFLVLLL